MNNNPANNLAKIVKERRRAKGWTLAQMSSATGISPSFLSRIERGERIPSWYFLKKLAEPLGFTVMELLQLTGFLSRDEGDNRLERFKKEIKSELADMFISLHKKIDSL